MGTPTLPNAPFRTPATDQNGLFTRAWVGWFTQLFVRAGGNVAPSLSDVDSTVSSLQSSVTSLQTTVSSLSSTVSSLQSTVNGHGTDISGLEDAVNGLNLEPVA